MSKTTNKFYPKVNERAVRLELDNEGQHGFRRQAIVSVSAKIGYSATPVVAVTNSRWIPTGLRPSNMQ